MKLGELEKKVMDYIWDACSDQSFSVRDVMNGLHITTNKPYAYNTILTVITHLYDKELLQRDKTGKTFTYSAKICRDEFVAKTSREIFTQMQQEYGTLAIAHFANLVDSIDPALLAEAQKKLKR